MSGAMERGSVTIEGAATQDNTVPAEVLVRTVERLQRLLLLSAGCLEGHDFRQRFKPPAELRAHYQLRLGTAFEGSWGIPFLSTGSEHVADRKPAMSFLLSFLLALSANDRAKAESCFPTAKYRDAILFELREMSPSEGQDWSLSLALEPEDGEPAKVAKLDAATRRRIAEFLIRDSEQVPGCFIGFLHRLDFESQKMTLVHPTTRVKVTCNYLHEHEETLLKLRRERVQVVGNLTRNASGDVEGISNVTMVQGVDLEPMTISTVTGHGRTLHLSPPLEVRPAIDEDSGQFFTFKHESLDLDIVAPTREDLVDEIYATLVFLWEQYALADDSELTDGAKRLKDQLRTRIREDVAGGATKQG